MRIQKKDDRSRRLGYFHALSVPPSKHSRQPSDNIALLHPSRGTDGSYSMARYVHPYDAEDTVIDVGPSGYAPLAIQDRDLPALPVQPTQKIAPLQTASRQVRPLPQRPITRPAQHDGRVDRQMTDLPVYIRGPVSPEREDLTQSLSTSELSSTAHSALLSHAAYVRSTFCLPSSTSADLESPPPYTTSRQ